MTQQHDDDDGYDGYDGAVVVGGPPATRTLGDVVITKLAVGPMGNNAYLLRCRRTDVGCLVDAAAEASRILTLVGGDGLALVVTTHRHADHWQALSEVVAATGATTAAGLDDVDGIPVPTHTALAHGDTLAVGDVRLGVIALRGHTPGAIALRYDDPRGGAHLFTGDSLFPGGPGRTTTPASFTSLMDDLESKVFTTMGDNTWVYPGHGNDTTLGVERPHLAQWRARGW